MQIRRSRHRGSSPFERALSFHIRRLPIQPFQYPDRPYFPTAYPNAPLGAGLCIFNKFRESSRSGRCSEGGFSADSQTVSSRLFMCEEFAIHLSSPSIFSSLSPSSCPVDLAFSFPLLIHISHRPFFFTIFFSPIFKQLTFHRSFFYSSFFSIFFFLSSSLISLHHLSPPRRSFSRALSWRGVNSSLEHGQQDNACLLKTSF